MNIEGFKGIVYSAINLKNNKRYIGQTTRSLHRRKLEHISNAYRMGKYSFHLAILKHGEDNFKWEVLDYADTIEELDKKELYWIEYYDTYRTGGYNMSVGGQLSKRTEGNAEDISKMLGGREFLVFDIEGNLIDSRYSQTQFAKEIGASTSGVNDVLVGKKNRIKGHIMIFKDEYSEEKLINKINSMKYFKKFFVYRLNGEFVGSWNKQVICANDLGIHHSSVGKCLKGILKQTIGYTFTYEEVKEGVK